MKRSLQVCSALLAMAFASLYLGAQPPATVALNTYIDCLHREGAFNGNILVADKGKVILERAVGNVHASGTLRLDIADRFEIVRSPRRFDSVGLLMLKQQESLLSPIHCRSFSPSCLLGRLRSRLMNSCITPATCTNPTSTRCTAMPRTGKR